MAINLINRKLADDMTYQYIVFQQFVNQKGESFGSGQVSIPCSFKEAAKRYHEAREFRDGSEFRGCMPVRVGVARVPLNYSGFSGFHGTFEDLCLFLPQVSVICR